MRGPHIHITSVRGWLQHHHDSTTVDGSDAAVRLLTREESDDATVVCDAAALPAWLDAQRGGVVLPRSWARRGCDDGPEVVVPGESSGFRVLSNEADEEFVTALPDARFAANDHLKRAWFLSADGASLTAWDAGLDVQLSDLTLAAPADLFAVGEGGILTTSRDGAAWWRPFDDDSSALDLGIDASEIVASVIALGHSFLVLVLAPDGRGRIVETRGIERINQTEVASLDCPLALTAAGGNEFYLTERDGSPPAKTRFHRFAWESGLLPIGEAREVRGFDGRFVFEDEDGVVLASWSGGLRALYGARTRYAERGFVETVHYDSGRQLCQWDRVFIDVCVPSGCSVEVEVRTAESLDHPDMVLPPTSPPGLDLVEGAGQSARLDPAFGTDVSGWERVLGYDDLGPDGDVPQVGIPAGRTAGGRARWTTLEGFITNARGRYLWVRIRLNGTRSATPRVFACRVSFPRPNVLDLLPAFWQRDRDQAAKMGRFLALFEAELTRTDALIRHLNYLFDPRSTPPDALEWLGAWVGVALDDRIPMHARRTLVREAVELYRTRGTVVGLTRVIEIVSGVEAVIVEGFRLRRRDAPILGIGEGTMLGDVLPLGGTPPVADDVEPRLVAGWEAGRARREIRKRSTGQPCPEDLPPNPVLEPGQAFYSAFAHRFMVVLIGDVCEERLAAVDDAIEAWKPAHTVHSLCVTAAGVRVGSTARPGYSAIAASREPFPPYAILGEDLPIGARYTLGPHEPLRTVDDLSNRLNSEEPQ